MYKLFALFSENLKWIYLSYFLIVTVSFILFLNDSFQLVSPILVLSVVSLHFIFAGVIALNVKNSLKKRYSYDRWGIIALISDLLLIASLIFSAIWIKNYEDNEINSYIPLLAISTAFIGNIGCFILRFLRK